MIYENFNLKQDPKIQGLPDSLMQMVQKARTIAGIPFIITSGGRTTEENDKIKGAKNSAHLRFYAVDILCKNDNERFLIEKGAYIAGFRRIGKGKDHVHLDIDLSLQQDVSFVEIW